MYRGVVSIDMCYSQGGRISYPPVEIIIPGKCTRYFSCPRLCTLTTVVFVPRLCTVLSTLDYVLDAHDEWYIKYVCLYTSGSYITPT